MKFRMNGMCRISSWNLSLVRLSYLGLIYSILGVVGNLAYAGQNFVVVPEGVFLRGDVKGEPERYMERSRPVSEVYISRFFIGETQVTYEQWKKVYDWAIENGYEFDNPGQRGSGPRGESLAPSEYNNQHPVVKINWYDVLKWCNAKSEKSGLIPAYYTSERKAASDVYRSGRHNISSDHVLWENKGYRLPTEGEWEKAARGGLEGKRWPWGDENINSERANYWDGDNVKGTMRVGSYPSNPYGLYDMAGNVWEWCWDRYVEYDYNKEIDRRDPRGPDIGGVRVIRGGSWGSGEGYHRCAYRSYIRPDYSGMRNGFRLVFGGTESLESRNEE